MEKFLFSAYAIHRYLLAVLLIILIVNIFKKRKMNDYRKQDHLLSNLVLASAFLQLLLGSVSFWLVYSADFFDQLFMRHMDFFFMGEMKSLDMDRFNFYLGGKFFALVSVVALVSWGWFIGRQHQLKTMERNGVLVNQATDTSVMVSRKPTLKMFHKQQTL